MIATKNLKEIFGDRFSKIINHIDPHNTMSQKEIAGKIGISEQSFTDYLSKAKFPNTVNYIKIVKYFNSQIQDFNDDYLIGNSNSMNKRFANPIPSCPLTEEVTELIQKYEHKQQDLANILSMPSINRIAGIVTSIKAGLESEIVNIINEWPQIKQDFNYSPLLILKKLLKSDDERIRKHTESCKDIINSELDIWPYTILNRTLQNMINEKPAPKNLDIIKDLSAFLKKHIGEVRFIAHQKSLAYHTKKARR